MKILKEDVLFAGNELSRIKEIVSASSLKHIVSTEEDNSLIERIVTAVYKQNVKDDFSSTYLALKAASYGPSTSSNYLLLYLSSVSYKDIVYKYPKQVNRILDYIIDGTIKYSNKRVDTYLLNPSLYNRSKDELDYTVKAFIAVIYDKQNFFDVDSSNRVQVLLPSKESGTLFFGDSLSSIGDEGSAVSSDRDGFAGDVVSATVTVDEKYFYQNMVPSTSDTIIPSGLGGSNISERTIWNYMELWSNPDPESVSTNKEDTKKQNKQENTRKQNKMNVTTANLAKRGKQLIAKSRMSDNDKNELSSIIDQLYSR